MLFKLKFNEMLQEVKRDLVSFTMACDEIRNSEKLGQVIKLILSIGNVMHAGTPNGRAIGFEISFLPKIINTKTVDNKSSLLRFIASIMEEKYPESVRFYEDILHLDKASKGLGKI